MKRITIYLFLFFISASAKNRMSSVNITMRIMDRVSVFEVYASFELESVPARSVVKEHKGMKMYLIGINQPIKSIMHPKYIIASVNIENMNVEKSENSEIPPKVTVLISIVNPMAKTLEKSEILMKNKALFDLLGLLSRQYSPSTRIPKVAKADSHRATSKIAYGVTAQIMNSLAPCLKENGVAVVTLKLPSNPSKGIEESVAILSEKYHVLSVNSLFHNRQEVTAYIQKRGEL